MVRFSFLCVLLLTTGLGLARVCAAQGVNASAAGKAEETADEAKKPLQDKQNWKLTRGAKDLSVEFGFAPTQPTFLSGRKEYNTDGRKFAMTSIRFGRVIGTVKHVTYQYLFEVIPISISFKNEVATTDAVTQSDGAPDRRTVRKNTYGIGFQPAGFRLLFAPSKRIKPYIQAGAGFIFTRKPIPVPESTNYNFIGDFGGGLMYSISRRRTMNFGYRYFHISNMNIGAVNPGYNANVFYLGFSFFSK